MKAAEQFAPERRRQLVIRRGRERVVANRHPWIFAGAIEKESGPEDAAIADLVDPRGARIASGFYSRHSQIRLRALAFEDEELTPELIEARIARALRRRSSILDGGTDAVRLIHSEGDDLSGIVADRYADVVVLEIANRGADHLRDFVVDVLRRELGPRSIHCSNDLPARVIERLPTGDETIGDPDPSATITESGLRFRVDPRAGQKTGFFLDQRDNRRLARELAAGRSVLNLFSYSGAFGVYAAAGGAAEVTNVDVSAPALELAAQNHALNGSSAQGVVADAFQFVRREPRRFGLVVCDPPAFARSRGEVDRAARGYKDVNLHAMRMVEPGGLMMTFSCSGHVSLDLFQKIIFAAAIDSGRRVSFLRRLGAGADHPVSLYCPEGEYLKGFLLEAR